MTIEPSPAETPRAEPPRQSAFPRVFRHRNYRLFYAGQCVTLIGGWIQAVALSWLVYELSHSVFLLGLVSFMSQAPIFFVTPFAGMIADRADRRLVFMATRAASLVQALILTVLTLTGNINVEIIIVLALALGIVTAIEVPTRQAFTVQMVGREDLPQAIAFNAMMFNFTRTLGPAIGGLIVAGIGEGLCFLVNTVSSSAVLVSLFLMKISPREPRPTSRPWDDLKQGFVYVTRHPHIRMVLVLSTICSCFGTSYLALMPAFAQDILHQGPDGLGYLLSAFGAGAVLGAALVSRQPAHRLKLLPSIMAVVLGLSLILFATTQVLWLAILFVIPTGFAYLGIAVSSNTQVQLMAEDAMLGRVMAFYAMGALGSPPLGALLLGYVSGLIGVPDAFMLAGALCLAAAALSFASLKRRGELNI
ncbi:MAG: MFS transporter [Alphaproteobacteria bacterium]|nr:MFS transporter [Alphaproteobacteria bacterium]